MRFYFLMCLLIFSASIMAQEKSCADYKDGKFEIRDARFGNFKIERNGDKQIEYGPEAKLKLEFKVQWLSECSYTLTLVKVLENLNGIQYPTDMILTVEIIEAKEGSYLQKSSSNLSDMVMTTEMIKVD